jgi:hypothetical protein
MPRTVLRLARKYVPRADLLNYFFCVWGWERFCARKKADDEPTVSARSLKHPLTPAGVLRRFLPELSEGTQQED